jgi:hypothetical protein
MEGAAIDCSETVWKGDRIEEPGLWAAVAGKSMLQYERIFTEQQCLSALYACLSESDASVTGAG